MPNAREVTAHLFFTEPATTEIYTLSLHDALPISFYQAKVIREHLYRAQALVMQAELADTAAGRGPRQEKQQALEIGRHTSELQSRLHLVCRLLLEKKN